MGWIIRYNLRLLFSLCFPDGVDLASTWVTKQRSACRAPVRS